MRKEKQAPDVPLSAEELQEITDAYDSSIAWVDSEFGKILAQLKAKELYDDSLIIFLADHGEALGEHGVLGHGGNVYDETTQRAADRQIPEEHEPQGPRAPAGRTRRHLPDHRLRFSGSSWRWTAATCCCTGFDDDLGRPHGRFPHRQHSPPPTACAGRTGITSSTSATTASKLFLLTADPRQDVAAPPGDPRFSEKPASWTGTPASATAATTPPRSP